MQYKHFSIISFLGFLSITHAFKNCPLIGPDFPAPTNLTSSTTIQKSLRDLTQILSQAKTSSKTSNGLPFDGNVSFSVEIFSIHDTEPTFSQSFPSNALATFQDGTKTLNSSTTYRIGSLTKLFTVFVFLIEAGDTNWNEPITKYVPELLEASEALNATENPIDYVAWEDITIGVLASQLADIGRDYSGFGELDSILNAGFDPTTAGLPTLNATEGPVCEGGAFCNRQQFFQGFTERHPVYAPGTAPIYSNAAYMILSYALENITGIDFPTSVQNSLLGPLKLSKGTSWFQPSFNDTAIIPDNSAWNIPLGDETAAGGMYATPSDIAIIGRSILSSTLLPAALTRRWLKPHSFTSSPTQSVGAPWEIQRLSLSPNSRLVEMYTKAGDLPGYASLLVLIPDWDLGFAVLAAGDPTVSSEDNMVVLVADAIADVFFPAVEEAAREEADRAFSGSYTSSNSTLKSSITLTTDAALPGLGLKSWISNGVDVLASGIVGPNARLYPTGLKRSTTNGETIVGFRAVFENPAGVQAGGVFSMACTTWEMVDSTYWGEVATDEFLFTVGANGIATSVTPRIMRQRLGRVGH